MRITGHRPAGGTIRATSDPGSAGPERHLTGTERHATGHDGPTGDECTTGHDRTTGRGIPDRAIADGCAGLRTGAAAAR